MAWNGGKNADQLANRVMARPHVQARITELREQADKEGIGNFNEMRRQMWETIRSKADGKPSHGERVRAAELDAKLAGYLKADAITPTEIHVSVVVGALAGMGSPSEAALRNVTPSPPTAAGEASGVGDSLGFHAESADHLSGGSSNPRTTGRARTDPDDVGANPAPPATLADPWESDAIALPAPQTPVSIEDDEA